MTIQPTPYDLRWRMFGIPVSVHPTFWLIAVLFSWPLTNREFPLLFVGIGVIFISILLHELSHALAFAMYRMPSAILLYSFGGLTMPEAPLRKRAQRIVVSLAGPAANFAIAATTWGSQLVVGWAGTNLYTFYAYIYLIGANLFLGIFNLMPVLPLDGGQVSRELLVAGSGRRGYLQALQLSIAVAAGIAAFAIACEFQLIPPTLVPLWLQPGMFAAIIFGMLAVQNYFELQNQRQSPW
jgi:Zn-dependent protease